MKSHKWQNSSTREEVEEELIRLRLLEEEAFGKLRQVGTFFTWDLNSNCVLCGTVPGPELFSVSDPSLWTVAGRTDCEGVAEGIQCNGLS